MRSNKSLFLVLILMTFVGCKDENDFGEGYPSESRPVSAFLIVSPSSLSFTSAPSSKSLIIKTNQNYTVTTSASWITATTSSDNKTVAVSVSENIEASDRSGTITFKVGGWTQKVSVEQSAKIIGYCPDINHPHMIDMGTAGKWACCNVGASSPQDYGDCFACGETSPKTEYQASNYKWGKGDYNLYPDSLTKYCEVDKKTQLELSDDAARVNWGGTWRMPTIDEQKKLDICTWTWSSLNNVHGYKVTSSNGNSIFLPAAHSDNSYGYYWSSSLEHDGSAICLFFDSRDHMLFYETRWNGRSVRPVTGAFINVFPVSFSFTSTASSGSLTIETDENYSITTSASWITATASSDKKKVTISVSENKEASSRSGTVTFKGGGLTQIVSVEQSANILAYCPDTNHPHLIDMGTAGKWACCNVGASSPEDYGDCFAWGETTGTKYSYSWSTYNWCNGSSDSMTKYCNNSSYGTVDNKIQLDLSDDAARVNWGGSWRMPTIDELSELGSNCIWTWTTLNNLYGYKVTATNGNNIFLPAAGYISDSSLLNAGSSGYYWSSSLYTSDARARVLSFNSSYQHTEHYGERFSGLSVRPVTD